MARSTSSRSATGRCTRSGAADRRPRALECALRAGRVAWKQTPALQRDPRAVGSTRSAPTGRRWTAPRALEWLAMKLEPFQMERMQSEWENRVSHNLSESGVHPLTVEELLEPKDREEVLRQRLLYIQSNGTDELRSAIAALYPGAQARNVVVTTGTAEANYIAIWRLVEPARCREMLPTTCRSGGWSARRGRVWIGSCARSGLARPRRLGRPSPAPRLVGSATPTTRRIGPDAEPCGDRGPRRKHGAYPGTRSIGAERRGRDADVLGRLRPPARDLRAEPGLRPPGSAS